MIFFAALISKQISGVFLFKMTGMKSSSEVKNFRAGETQL